MGKYHYNVVWEHGPNKNWVRCCATDKYKARCIACKKDIDIGSMGESALKSHARDPKHVKKLNFLMESATDNKRSIFFAFGCSGAVCY